MRCWRFWILDFRFWIDGNTRSSAVLFQNPKSKIQNAHDPKSKIPNQSRQSGQALLELAIFGSMLLLTLGLLVSYGLSADFTQQGMMQTFREAMVTSAHSQDGGTPISTSHLSLTQRQIPDPSDPFAIGGLQPIAAQAESPSRAWLGPAPESLNELPRLQITVQGLPVNCPATGSGCLAAGFRTENDVSGYVLRDGKWVNDQNGVGAIDKYQEVYGNVTEVGPGACPSCRNVRIIDSCEGEILSYATCYQRAALLVDPSVCQLQCERGKVPGDTTTNCPASCAIAIPLPWYAQNASRNSQGAWVFPELDQLFANVTALGVQPNESIGTQSTTSLDKTEEAGQTVATVTQQSVAARDFLYKPYGATNWQRELIVRSPINEQVTTTSNTPRN